MSGPRRDLLDRALVSGRPIHVIAGLGVDDLAAIGLTALDAPLAALSWLRLEPGPSGSLELAHRSLSLRLDPHEAERARGRLSFISETPAFRLRDLAARGPLVGHALESTLIARIDRTTATAIADSLVDLVDLVAELGGPTEPGERALGRLLGRTPTVPADPLERAELLTRYYRLRPSVSEPAIADADAFLVGDDGVTPIVSGSRPFDEYVGGTPERLALAGGLAMIVAAERLGSPSPSASAVALLRGLGGAPELSPAGPVLIVDRDGGARVRESYAKIRSLLSLPQGG